MSIILNTDSYKASHYLQYPPDTEFISSYIEARGGETAEVLFFGLQAFIKKYLLKPITLADIDEAEPILRAHGLPFNRAGWMHILNKHNGYLPLRIQALPEGTLVPVGCAQVQVINTDPQCAWLTSYIETSLLRAVWYPSTVATLSHCIKRLIRWHMNVTCDNLDGLPFKLHDFGARGVSSKESAGLGGMAHLLNFSGTDTLEGLLYARRYYGANMPGFSIPAAEHSTITSWGRLSEHQAFTNMQVQFKGLKAIVADSYNIYDAARWFANSDLVHSHPVVVRPDSGNPLNVLPNLFDILAIAGTTTNSKGFKLLHPNIRVIWGDGINIDSISTILSELWAESWSTDNIAFGMGGALLQQVNRDTHSYAMKASALKKANGEWIDVYKEPATDSGKKSKQGRLGVVNQVDEGLITVSEHVINHGANLFRDVYLNGKLLINDSFDEIKARITQ